MRSRWLAPAVLALVGALALGGCGRRGALEPPPDPAAVAAEPAPDSAVQPIPRRPKKVPVERPAGGFVLDPLL